MSEQLREAASKWDAPFSVTCSACGALPGQKCDAGVVANLHGTRRTDAVLAALAEELIEQRQSMDVYHQEYESQGVIYKPLHGWSCDCDERSSDQVEARLVSSWRPVSEPTP